ncbi:MAG: hypothetical protein V1809_05530 [Planctomycetota bacterium]
MNPNPTPCATTDPPPAPPRAPRRIWKMLLPGAIILICGVILGSGGTLLWLRHKMHQAIRDPHRMPAELTERIRTHLDLSEEQTAKIGKILRDRHDRLMRTHHQTFQAEIDGMRADVAAELTPDQARRWNADFESILRFPRFPPPPPGGMPFHGPPPGEMPFPAPPPGHD